MGGTTATYIPKTDLHYHLDAMPPRAIRAVSDKYELRWAGKSLNEVAILSQAPLGSTWDAWYRVHTAARRAVFVKPEVFKDVALEAIEDAKTEGLEVRVFRFSLSMAQFCFMANNKRKPDFENNTDKATFLKLFDEIIENLSNGIATSDGTVRTPLVFSFSCQDEFLPILDDIATLILNQKQRIAGIDLTNEQTHRLATEYSGVVERIRTGGIRALTIHSGEKEIQQGKETDERGRRLYRAEERIRAALQLKPDTLGHAIYSTNNPKLIEEIARSGTTVELCPTSNLYLNDGFVMDVLHGDHTKYPLRRFLEGGIRCTINSDVPGSVGGSLMREFELIRGLFNLNNDELMALDIVAKEVARNMYGV